MRKPLKIQGRSRVHRVLAKVASERLINAAIERHGHCYSGFKSHAEIRKSLGDPDIYASNPNDLEGFLTNKARFVDRDAARMVAINACNMATAALTLTRDGTGE